IASTLELRDLLRAIAANVRDVMQCDGAGVALPDRDGSGLRLYALDFPSGKGLIREDLLFATSDQSSAVEAFQTGEPVAAVDDESNWKNPLAAAEGVKSLCHVPLVSRERKLGVLTLARLTPIPFTPRDLEFLTLIAKQAAIAVENALAYREI